MSLAPGTRLGPYEIQAAIGAGGMGEVYRATDTNLKRAVAIKVLPESLASDPDRLARFRREAEVLASLNHPNIAQIYGLEKSDGTTALVMELVDGEDLSQRITRGPIPVDEALPIAKQIAEALEAAHEQGIIHRDLKPANIKVRPDGTVKVLDFGLAKLAESASGQPAAGGALSMSPTITSPAMMTGVGVLLGTAAYMAPEQAKGRPADKRSDIWAFGCVFYEMLTGRRAFAGDDVSDTLASILKTDPTWTSLPPTALPALRRLLRRCLEKDARRRLQAIGEARVAIEDWLGGARDEELAHAAKPKSRTAMLVGTAAVAAVGIISSVAWTVTRQSPSTQEPRARFTIVPPPAQAVNTTGDRSVAISPDGTRVVYAGGPAAAQQLFVRRIDDLDVVALRGTEGGDSPAISPDDRWVAFNAGSDLKKVALAGGAPITLCTCLGSFALRGMAWGPDNTILIATNDSATGLLSVPASGGEAKVITKPDTTEGEQEHFFPSTLPGGRVVLFTVIRFGSIENAEIAALDLSSGRRKTLIRGGSQGQYVETGHLIYAEGGALRAVRFDPARLEIVGDPISVLEGVLMPSSGSGLSGAADFNVSNHGTLVYMPSDATGQIFPRRSLVWVDRQGREEPINAPLHTYGSVRLSPDGARVAVDVRESNSDIWAWDFARKTFTRLTFDQQLDDNPVWAPDGRQILFRSLRAQSPEIYREAANGTGTAERLTAESRQLIPKSISPDGRRVVLLGQSGKTGNDLRLLTLDGNKPKTTPLLQAIAANVSDGDVSPDGHWLAYASDESGRSEIYVRPFPAVEAGRWQVSNAGGTVPQWARNGRELFYIDGSGAMTSAPVQTMPTFVAGQPVKLFDAGFSSGTGRRYDVAADGKRFLMVKEEAGPTSGGATNSIVVVQNWFEELKRLVPAK